MNVIDLPFNQLVGLRKPRPEEDGLLVLDGAPRHGNHLGTVHAAAQFALAEACSGEFLLGRFGELAADHLAVLRGAETKFKRPAQGTLVARARMAEEQSTRFRHDLLNKGRASLSILVEVVDAAGKLTMTGAFEWIAQRMTWTATTDPGE